MQQAKLKIVNKLGLHARAAAKLVGLAKSFESTIELEKQDKQVDAKSIMSVLLLEASLGTEVTLTADGGDEEQAIAELTALINDRFGEGE